ncbi:hypothetical protein VIOR3934_18033 [Vibrio orientalis CIP 102891 = ATCC 33934]|uniref:Uncharacterized protein n=1 Tax=Vibrio orientalis CIP 102891 = ATCC 33934 TaxID=675816 RepID=F9SWW3_VIBOR|nr:hypothetical protein VIOR3934_18033 [Vibrio orientalis CIP 102891 = ATCC 33934]
MRSSLFLKPFTVGTLLAIVKLVKQVYKIIVNSWELFSA